MPVHYGFCGRKAPCWLTVPAIHDVMFSIPISSGRNDYWLWSNHASGLFCAHSSSFPKLHQRRRALQLADNEPSSLMRFWFQNNLLSDGACVCPLLRWCEWWREKSFVTGDTPGLVSRGGEGLEEAWEPWGVCRHQAGPRGSPCFGVNLLQAWYTGYRLLKLSFSLFYLPVA